MTIKLVLLSVLFVVSGGVFFSEAAKKRPALIILVGLLSIVSTYYLLDSIYDDFASKRVATDSSEDNPPMLGREDFDIYANTENNSVFLFHGKELPYDDFDKMIYDYYEKKIEIIGRSGEAFEIDNFIPCAIEPHMQIAQEISIVRTKDREPIDGTIIPLLQAYPDAPVLKRNRGNPGYLGVSLSNEVQVDFTKPGRSLGFSGARVDAVTSGSPADLAGIIPGDTIVKYDDRLIRNKDDLIDCIRAAPPGHESRLDFVRSSVEHSVIARISSRE